ncbi:hypothetical protein M441DRAFT_379237 [Trichoderma asperellum CBS 433.97]|uniref:Uncharacterized protein n=1 Tax=Trichoderma asperellum (strain ATCC 204424 / CBS 433.97 / NBRC 101777) TaxID=1042311 RepID=A0A2T3ZAV7_TRIA4|nr:hypothetical protein M441DRAFT_379237 [Trichoderma asperellum CBS 433.97]PTB41937.1 hypothetical protein M441DRAFT_379237 [Trichoderma asperellum CBS 433.97]
MCAYVCTGTVHVGLSRNGNGNGESAPTSVRTVQQRTARKSDHRYVCCPIYLLWCLTQDEGLEMPSCHRPVGRLDFVPAGDEGIDIV